MKSVPMGKRIFNRPNSVAMPTCAIAPTNPANPMARYRSSSGFIRSPSKKKPRRACSACQGNRLKVLYDLARLRVSKNRLAAALRAAYCSQSHVHLASSERFRRTPPPDRFAASYSPRCCVANRDQLPRLDGQGNCICQFCGAGFQPASQAAGWKPALQWEIVLPEITCNIPDLDGTGRGITINSGESPLSPPLLVLREVLG